MILRSAILLVLLAAIGFQLDREQRAGRFQQADDLFLDFLLANVRDRFVVDESKRSDQVVLVRMREEEKAEYGAWPPPPIDWQMVLKGLVPFEPEVVVIATPLTWGQPPPEFVSQVGQALLPFTSVVLAVEGREGKDEKDPKASASMKEMFPSITRVQGDAARVPAIAEISAMPDEPIRRQMALGLTVGDLGSLPPAPDAASTTARRDAVELPLVFRHGGAIAPSLALQALTHYTRTPYAQQRLLIGPGAGAHLGGGLYLPLAEDGRLVLKSNVTVPSVNALNFMTGTLADGLSAEDKATLGKNKIIVIGIDNDAAEPTIPRMQAQALAHALSLPRVHAIGVTARWAICAAAALLGCMLRRYRGGKALRTGLILIFGALVVSFLTFQSQLTWFPPTVPAAFLAASTLFAMVFGKKVGAAPSLAVKTAESAE